METINQRVIIAINHLLEQGIAKKKSDIAELLQCTPQTITEILGGRQGMKVDMLQKFFDEFNISYEYIFEGRGDILKRSSTSVQENAQNHVQESPLLPFYTGKSKSTITEKDENDVTHFLPDSGKTTSTNIIELPTFVDRDENVVSIPVVDISVAAGAGATNPDWMEEIDCIRMPRTLMKHNKTYLCVRIRGDSMSPTLQDGGYLIIRLLDRSEWQYVKEEHIYVVTEREGNAFVKRIKNRFKEHGFIVCMSDNPDVMRYPNFNLDEDEINTLWYVEWYLSAKMPNIHHVYYKKVSEMEDAIADLRFNLETQIRQVVRQEIKALQSPK